jgi:hypothetical protein
MYINYHRFAPKPKRRRRFALPAHSTKVGFKTGVAYRTIYEITVQ